MELRKRKIAIVATDPERTAPPEKEKTATKKKETTRILIPALKVVKRDNAKDTAKAGRRVHFLIPAADEDDVDEPASPSFLSITAAAADADDASSRIRVARALVALSKAQPRHNMNLSPRGRRATKWPRGNRHGAAARAASSSAYLAARQDDNGDERAAHLVEDDVPFAPAANAAPAYSSTRARRAHGAQQLDDIDIETELDSTNEELQVHRMLSPPPATTLDLEAAERADMVACERVWANVATLSAQAPDEAQRVWRAADCAERVQMCAKQIVLLQLRIKQLERRMLRIGALERRVRMQVDGAGRWGKDVRPLDWLCELAARIPGVRKKIGVRVEERERKVRQWEELKELVLRAEVDGRDVDLCFGADNASRG